YRVPLDDAPLRGGGALVTIVQFSDFECPFCGRVTPTLERLLEAYPGQVRIAFRHYPLPFHALAEPAAHAAIEVRHQLGDEAFWAFHDRLFAERRLTPDALVEQAAELGADGEAVRRAIAEGTHRDRIAVDRAAAISLAVSGTPAHFVNGRPLMGAQPFERFDALVREELALAQEAGADPSTWYATLLEDAPEQRRPERRGRRSRDRGPVVLDAPPPVPDHAPRRGSPDAPLVLQVFSDFECPFCSRFVPTLDRLLAQYEGEVQLVFRHVPLSMHEHARLAAAAAAEVRAQAGDEAFWRFHDLLFANQDALAREDLERWATEVGGVDLARFRAALEQGAHEATIEADLDAARDLGIRGTPSLVVGTHLTRGARPFLELEELVDRLLDGAGDG
ncbi:MAG TPA: thioredoxin domain-containing protein, partial [Polyangiaceae bacterium LLY-WYZ-15_(1-7)]|nr:thioredoxin domain-containing protein [Polyangiaceae bacterium LLY-WYZ-15_(1-7)]